MNKSMVGNHTIHQHHGSVKKARGTIIATNNSKKRVLQNKKPVTQIFYCMGNRSFEAVV